MRLNTLSVRNFKRVTIAELSIGDAAVVPVVGANGAGKSSLLDAIPALLGGKGFTPSKPIAEGAEEAEIEGTLGDGRSIALRAKRRISAGRNVLDVWDAEGAKVAQPQARLDALVGDLTFDSERFDRAPAREQVAILARTVGVDIAKHEAEREKAAATRTAANRALRDAEAAHAAMPVVEAPSEEVSVSELMRQLDAANESQRKVHTERELLADLARQQGDVSKEIEATERRLVQLRAAQDSLLAGAMRRLQDYKAAEAAAIDPAPIRRLIDDAENINRGVRGKRDRERAWNVVAQCRVRAEAASAAVDAIDASLSGQIAKAEIPVPGLTFDASGVRINGIPYDQCSTAERIRARIGIALAQHPALKVAIVRDGSLLDEESRRIVAEMAEAAGAQVFIELVDHGVESGYVMEDGVLSGRREVVNA